MIKKIAHIGIAVKNIDEQIPYYRDILGLEIEGTEIVEEQGVKVCFIKIGDTHIELLEPIRDNSPIKSFLDNKGEGVHHIAYESSDIREYISRMKEKGFKLLNEEPKKGAHNMSICFAHPKSTFGVLTEVCQKGKE
jgi:methylmalonyl-CoA epimerase